MPPRFACIGLVVADMDASLAFYRRLGLAFPADAAAPHAEAALPGGLRLLLDTASSAATIDPSWSPPQGSPRAALAFACDSPADVDATYADLVGAGYDGHLAPWDAVWGQRYAAVHDPDGNGIDLFAPREEAGPPAG